ncbi:fimbrial protein [[Enterobacter] lignolyticus]|uniref:Fimbrial protein domain-containing protein n=1 Tax=Enterobacter lignolyticus (strain SCF1) TaxID=701347 RepID=E3G631_ENTLS|nr:fimbrial protein [[Enterobacter] lignolyticus]ADO48412.1 Fimbrial protein domain-containing protein [[Enterobacter] lignolyticus SCF1]
MLNFTQYLCLLLGVISLGCRAVTCNIVTAKFNTVGFGVVSVQRDTPVGATLATTVSPGYAQVQTISSTGEVCPGNYAMVYSGGVESSMSGVFQTNLDGVGIKVSGMPGDFTLPVYVSSGGIYNLGYYTVSLVKTGRMTSGILAPGLIAQAWFGSPGSYFTQISLDANSQINVLSCSLSAQAMNFDLGSVSASEFGAAAGYIPARSDTQSLGLNCDPNANINIELKGVQNPDVSGNASVLALTGQGSQNVAGGVGVQLVYNNTPLLLNTRIVLKRSPGGMESFPLVARYYQTRDVVTAGQANATATLDITYQ